MYEEWLIEYRIHGTMRVESVWSINRKINTSTMHFTVPGDATRITDPFINADDNNVKIIAKLREYSNDTSNNI